MRENKKIKLFRIISGIILQGLFFYPWIRVNGRAYGSIFYLLSTRGRVFADVVHSDLDGTETVLGLIAKDYESAIAAFYVQLILLIIMQVLSLIHLLLVIFKRNHGNGIMVLPAVISMASAYMATVGSSLIFPMPVGIAYPGAVMIMACGVYIISKITEIWADTVRQEKEYSENERREKIEKRERLKFEGKYTSDFYHIIWKNFKYSWKDYRIFVSAGILSVSMLFIGSGMRELMKGMDQNSDIMSGRGMDVVLVNFFAVFISLSVFLITFILMFYLQNRMKSLGIFVTLGIRRRALYSFIALELACCVVFSFAGGILLGNVIIAGLTKVIKVMLGSKIVLGALTWRTYRMAFFMTLLVFTLAFIATFGIYKESSVTKLKDGDIKKEKIPGKFGILGALFGFVVLTVSLIRFSELETGEGISAIGGVIAGGFLIFYYVYALWLRWRKQKFEKKYYHQLIAKNPLYHKFQRTNRYILLLAMLNICALFVFSGEVLSSLIAPQPGEMLPYDYVCLANSEDDSLFAEMEQKYGAEVLTYPMVRVTSVDHTLRLEDYRAIVQPQGQNIGISESTFRELKKNIGEKVEDFPELDKDGKNIYVVYQQDIGEKAKPLDYYMDRKTPYLHIGQPLLQYNWVIREKLYPPREIAGYEIGSLIGALREGNHENIVVFSDEYFEKVKDNWKKEDYRTGEPVEDPLSVQEGVDIHQSPNKLTLVNVDEKGRKGVETCLKKFKQNHAFDDNFDHAVLSYYSKEQLISEKTSERTLNQIVNGFIVGMLLIISIFIQYLKAESEIKATRQRYEFLDYMGMLKKERIRALKQELARFVWFPAVIAAAVVPVLTVILMKLRQFRPEDMGNYVLYLIVTAVLYFAVQAAALKMVQYYVVRKVED